MTTAPSVACSSLVSWTLAPATVTARGPPSASFPSLVVSAEIWCLCLFKYEQRSYALLVCLKQPSYLDDDCSLVVPFRFDLATDFAMRISGLPRPFASGITPTIT